MGRDTREVWEKRVQRWIDSGLTAKEFATEIGVSASTLAHWRWKLGAEGRLGGFAKKAASGGTAFVEVVAPLVAVENAPAVEIERTPEAPTREPPEPLELVLRGGLRIRVPVRFDAGSLRRLVDTLEAR